MNNEAGGSGGSGAAATAERGLDTSHDDQEQERAWKEDYEAQLASDDTWLRSLRGRMVMNTRSGVVCVIAASGIVRRRIRGRGRRSKGKLPVARAVLQRTDGKQLIVNIDQLRASWMLLPEEAAE